MSDYELEKSIIATFEKAFKSMSNTQKEKLLYFGEGMVAVLDIKDSDDKDTENN